MNKEASESFWSRQYSFKIFDSLLENRLFSRTLLAASLACLLTTLLFDWGSFFQVFDEFKTADLYKISLFAQGLSPYSSREIWLAPYPPFYFMVWVVPYLLLSNLAHLSLNQIFYAIRVLSTGLSAFCGILLYKQLISQGFSKEKSYSLSSIFILCSVTAYSFFEKR